MSTPGPTQVLRILADMRDGDPQATEKLLPSVYEELRKLAHQKLEKEAPGLTLQTTALVHEAYLRLVGDEELRWNSRGHFFGAAAEAMRRILVERARRHQRQKHGGGWQRVALGEIGIPSSDATDEEILALDEALRKLESEAPGRAEVIKLRYYGYVVRHPTMAPEAYALALGAMERATTLDPDHKHIAYFLNTLGVAQYRCGQYERAVATLRRSDELGDGADPGNAAFIAMACHQLGDAEPAQAAMARLRELMQDPAKAADPDFRAFRQEAETLLGGEPDALPSPPR